MSISVKSKCINKKVAFFLLAFAATLVWLSSTLPPRNELTVAFLNVGQGDSILLRTPEQHLVLIDGGPGRSVLSELSEMLAPWERRIDLLILTHPERDHMEGLLSVIDRYRVQALLMTGVHGRYQWEEFLQNVQQKKIPVFFAEHDRDIVLGDVRFDVVYPLQSLVGVPTSKLNNTSIAVRVSYGKTYLLFTGDAEATVEDTLVHVPVDLCAHVLKLGHHGSRTSTSMPFLTVVAPQIAVASVGKGNRYGHPHPDVLSRLERNGVRQMFRTDRDGRVVFGIRKNGDIILRQPETRRIAAPSVCNFLSSRS